MQHPSAETDTAPANSSARQQPPARKQTVGGSECVACEEAARAAVCVPCGHCALCMPCAQRWLAAAGGGPRPCPICREEVRGWGLQGQAPGEQHMCCGAALVVPAPRSVDCCRPSDASLSLLLPPPNAAAGAYRRTRMAAGAAGGAALHGLTHPQAWRSKRLGALLHLGTGSGSSSVNPRMCLK